jgi:hypothetical protein
MSQKQTDYSQWYVESTAQIARDAFQAFRDTGCSSHYLYYKPLGLAFAVVQDEIAPPSGFALASSERIPSNRTLEGLTAWVRSVSSCLPILPGD